MSARDEILARVRGATADVTTRRRPGGRAPVPAAPSPGAAETLELFAENVADYRATVLRAEPSEVGLTVADALRAQGCRSVVVPTGLDHDWLREIGGTLEVRPESGVGTSADLDAVDAVVTASAVGVATTGTIVLDHRADQGRRELSLVPDTHICVIRADQVVHDVPEAVARLRPDADGARPLTWISGPSATSDIELERVEGVHGPRNLVVVVVTPSGHGSPSGHDSLRPVSPTGGQQA
jgi:L-lactate dehydrogenase complex protein LldG